METPSLSRRLSAVHSNWAKVLRLLAPDSMRESEAHASRKTLAASGRVDAPAYQVMGVFGHLTSRTGLHDARTGQTPSPASRCVRAWTAILQWKTRRRRSQQLVEQGFGLLQIGSVKPIGEPAVNLRQQLAGRGALPLILPQPREAQRGAELQHLGLLVTGHLQRLLETGLGLVHIGERELEQ